MLTDLIQDVVATIDQASIQHVRVRLAFPVNHFPVNQNLVDFLHAIVEVQFASVRSGIRIQNFGCIQSDKTLRRRIMSGVDPLLPKPFGQRKLVKEAAQKLLARIREAGRNAIQEYDKSELHSKAWKASILRQETERRKVKKIAVDSIVQALQNGASDLSLEELKGIWEDCQVHNVLKG